MKNKFLKNIIIFAFSMVSVLVYFKILTQYVDVDILAEYFKVKALGLILYYLFSFRYSEFAYILKAERNYKITRLKNIFGLYVIYPLLFSVVFIVIINISSLPLYVYILSYLIFLLNDVVDSYVSINRLYHNYLVIFFIKSILIFKPLLFYIIFVESGFKIEFNAIFLFELYFHFLFAIFIFFLILKKVDLKSLFLYKQVYLNNFVNIKNTWLGSISKIPYEALPTFLLSFFVSSLQFVEYNIARKVYSMVIYANQPFLQVLNTISLDFKTRFKKYSLLYYSIMTIINGIIGFILFKFGMDVIGFFSEETYATDHTLMLVYIMFCMYLFYSLIYPYRQFIVINKKLKENNKAIIFSIAVLLILIVVFIPLYTTYAISVIQPFGLIIPLLLTFIFVKRNQKL